MSHLLADVAFVPHPEMRRVKAAFWVMQSENPLYDPAHITREQASSLTGESRLLRWWSMEGFPQWFTNRDEFRHRLQYVADLALDSLEAILVNDQSQDSARVRAAQIVLEAAGKMPSRSTSTSKSGDQDDRITRMDRKELEEYIRRAAALLPERAATASPPEAASAQDVPDPGLQGR